MKPSTKRGLRTLYQATLSLLVVLPILATGLPLAGQGAVIVTAVALISKTLNALEDAGLVPPWLKDS